MPTVNVKCPTCVYCGKAEVLEVDRAGWESYRNGALIQKAFPSMPRQEREMLISGTHPSCWDDLYGDE